MELFLFIDFETNTVNSIKHILICRLAMILFQQMKWVTHGMKHCISDYGLKI